eukprot:5068051-Prymnesium_polylepis.1
MSINVARQTSFSVMALSRRRSSSSRCLRARSFWRRPGVFGSMIDEGGAEEREADWRPLQRVGRQPE